MLYAASARRRSVCRGFVLNLLALSACAYTATAPRPVRAPVAPDSVDGWAVTPKRSTWQGRELMCLVVSDDPSVDNLHSVAHPDHPRYRAFEELEDPHGALGVWPSAYAACAALERIASERKRPPTVLELGCGAGLPSLYASIVLESPRVVATDVEAVPLAFLKAARSAHAPVDAGSFATAVLDVTYAAVDDIRGFDVVVCADMLYDTDVATALGALLGAAACGAGAPEFVVCDPGRRGRDHFLDAFGAASGLSPMFVDQAVPDGCVDVFDGTPIGAVGVLAAR
ncbi:unnamed protein product [Pelagomonas calceolata]|jgi:predicted nicotinamide N-methyase|uniref:Methyltransferase domain-containing protein n=1 Tax=Pelagomonas calceolata TaxID=35677 RepID=A0A7S3ZKW5_9STRA|nr:unnamed protein product [Pelagomonas calceolata]|mmetsp:Transcript_5892/g.16650  ORF Transcript_5892/g.16650 Transcript_5892/m.16650 type:complete len:284 (+) Transcript_5892:86-937(+)